MPHAPERTVLITGVAGYWGGRLATRLLAQPHLRILGIDRRAPERLLPGLDFIKADVRNPLLVELLRAEQVETVVHLAWRERQWRKEEDFESNVIGAMQLIGACADAGVRQVVLKSTMAVYGAAPENPLYMPEDSPLAARSHYGYVRDALEVEKFVQEFAAEYPEVRLAVLRLPNVIGPDVDAPFTRLLRLPAIPELLGFDPLLQVIDADDAVAALAQAVWAQAGGVFNVAASGVLSLCQLAGMLGRPLLPVLHLCVTWGWPLLTSLPAGRKALAWFPIEPDYLRYPWTGDARRMREILGFEPQHSARQAVERYVQALRIRPFQDPAELRRFADDRLDDVITSRRGVRQAQGDFAATGPG